MSVCEYAKYYNNVEVDMYILRAVYLVKASRGVHKKPF